ncbi:DUF1801 domain-containing protein [Sphingosinicella sp. LHD-64]|uniref:DUF1801 domain-containing protein n=1 Tax=Sphingosinicella sp. LHD-64 TaxID=3072139 RepID=UPI00280E0A16|nr:DUF1801 domain-containing protein [Sphingosinicella sp. LHD-64]MDQ8755989.1 DUF1801 domain-containing protein [Sphingosinicella sp. LHD-64]
MAAELKTKPTDVGVEAFLDNVADPRRREDARAVRAMMERITGEPATMWGPSIVGFGTYHYKYDSGHEGTMCRLGFSPRKAELVLYVLTESEGQDALLARLGKHRTGKSCLYIKRLADVDRSVLEELVSQALAYMRERYPEGA